MLMALARGTTRAISPKCTVQRSGVFQGTCTRLLEGGVHGRGAEPEVVLDPAEPELDGAPSSGATTPSGALGRSVDRDRRQTDCHPDSLADRPSTQKRPVGRMECRPGSDSGRGTHRIAVTPQAPSPKAAGGGAAATMDVVAKAKSWRVRVMTQEGGGGGLEWCVPLCGGSPALGLRASNTRTLGFVITT